LLLAFQLRPEATDMPEMSGHTDRRKVGVFPLLRRQAATRLPTQKFDHSRNLLRVGEHPHAGGHLRRWL